METQTVVHGIGFGTGYQIFSQTILDAIEAAQYEVIFVTCFWARSKTREALCETLKRVSKRAVEDSRVVKVRIGFSSSSLFQKLVQFTNPRQYRDAELPSLGLPHPEELRGIDLQVNSVFYLPFSVWHPKFVIIDRKLVILPSCNVSWEDWFEGCLQLSGPLVTQFFDFWCTYWDSSGIQPVERDRGIDVYLARSTSPPVGLLASDAARHISSQHSKTGSVNCQFLPSPHNRNPRFRLPWQRHAAPPNTPLNRRLLELFGNARQSIFLQTPNLTSPPVLDALLDALRRGVDVTIVTSERLMILEQLVTAGTTTSRCIKRLVAAHKARLGWRSDLEAGHHAPGNLQVSYYIPRPTRRQHTDEPRQSHVKLTIVDDALLVFGSGNMDRASWYTSQELGVAFDSREFVAQVKDCLKVAMEGRAKMVYYG